MFVLASKESAEWVLANEVMGFREHAAVPALKTNDRVVLYVTRGARHNPTKDRARIVGVGRLTADLSASPRTIAGVRYPRTCPLDLTEKFGLDDGPEFAPLVEHLSFIKNKPAWSAYVRRTVVRLPDDDFRLMAEACGQVAMEMRRG